MANMLTATLDEFASPFKSIFATPAKYNGPDFVAFFIEELPYQGEGKQIVLQGKSMPHQPFITGGKQRLIKEYYPGNAEPAVQVLGGEEDNITIKGRFYAKHYRGTATITPEEMRTVPTVLRDEIDGVRKRGNLVKITLGEWERWGWIEHCKFNMKTLADVEYEIEFFIIGDKPPSKCKMTADSSFQVVELGVDLMSAALAFEANALEVPADFPGTIFDAINNLIGAVATANSVLVKFVEQVIKTGENAQKSANKALGLIKYTTAKIASFKKAIGFLSIYAAGIEGEFNAAISETKKVSHAKYILGVQKSTSKAPLVISDAMLAAATSKAPAYSTVASTQQKALAKTGSVTMESTLKKMQKQFEAIAFTIPIGRHLVKQGDTLQGISYKFYKVSDHWKAIYDHNKLTSTELTTGAILEIPRL